MRSIVYVDDVEEDIQALTYHLESDYRVISCSKGPEALSLIKREHPAALVLGLTIPEHNGFKLLSELKRLPFHLPVLILSKYTDPLLVVRALKEGASDFIAKPCHFSLLRHRLKLLIDRLEAAPNKTALTEAAEPQIIGSSKLMCSVREEIQACARSSLPVIIRGESGTGKELAALLIHRLSSRRSGPFEVRNMAAIPESLVVSELFGCEEGAFTDARSRPGCFEAAHGGTLFLDEIGDASLAVQTAMLRVVENGMVRPLGSGKFRHVDCRLISATNKDFESLLEQGIFRLDLRYRIEGLTLRMPPLREHKEDIPELVTYFLRQGTGEDRGPEEMDSGVLEMLEEYPWPGNIRQLKLCLERAQVYARGKMVRSEHIQF
ncbi:sigma-54 dependent transcriptional regulator [Treponema sp. OttesenSCG-928-L16]|nr:sigma-54 dependent transcriptional regulator [Treponema sp. OttesenSCG-928-L16]